MIIKRETQSRQWRGRGSEREREGGWRVEGGRREGGGGREEGRGEGRGRR